MEEEKKENLENTPESAHAPDGAGPAPAEEGKVQEDVPAPEPAHAPDGAGQASSPEEAKPEPAHAPDGAGPVEAAPAPDGEGQVEPEDVAEEDQPTVEPTKPEGKWYVIQTFTGQEERVKQSIQHTIELKHLKEKVFQVLVPTEEIVEIKGGKRVEKVKMMFPGYVFLEMILDEESWYLIRQTPGVSRFIGNKVKPTPVSGKEMQRVLKQLGKEERLEITFEKGEAVRVISGPFRGYTGTVDEINPEKGKLKILINIFGRDTPVEVNFEHAQKIV